MSLSIYDVSIPILMKYLKNLSSILDKAARYAETKKFDSTILVNARLAPDMFPLSRQVQIACDIAKGCAARLAGATVPSYNDDESTIAELQTRISKTLSFIESINAADINEGANREIILKVGSKELFFKGDTYLTVFVLPNFYFHVSTTYAILRHNGLEIGKSDYLGK